MDISSFVSKLKENKIEYSLYERMKKHTTFKIGGEADVFVAPLNEIELEFVLKTANEYSVPVFILGKGSNILVSDKGIEGAVVCLNKMDKITVEGEEIICESGANLSAVCMAALENGLTGLEFAYGIPGSVGGALYMNAGAYGGEMSDVVACAYCIDKNGNETYIEKDKMELSYRHSVFMNGLIVTKVILKLKKGDKAEIKAKMQELLARRKDKQPLDFPSAGSTFKRPQGNFAGTLIEKCGLKGEKVGGAAVSQKHAGFIINQNNATSKDVLDLIDKVRQGVYKSENIMLEPEVIFVGRR
ncbi:MAG: UDP-N-acetylmuramate dehydrogenase [Clostridia bacterium]|nr:UDP-N-acetylmuramate dehydrogenase [Clostridia bacterium]